MSFQFRVCFVTEDRVPASQRWMRYFENLHWKATTKLSNQTDVLEDTDSEFVVVCEKEESFEDTRDWLSKRCTKPSDIEETIDERQTHFCFDNSKSKQNRFVQHVLLIPLQRLVKGNEKTMMATEKILHSILLKCPNSTNLMLPRIDYINLDKRSDRKVNFEASMAGTGVNKQNLHRFAAIEQKHGCIGCTQSHCAVLRKALKENLPFVIVCEDDCVWKSEVKQTQFVKQCRDFVLNYNNDWDMLILAASVHHFKSCATNVENLHRVVDAQTTTAYIVNGPYIPKLLENFETSEKKLCASIAEGSETRQKLVAAQKQFALDVYWKKLQKEDRWFIFLPPYFKQQDDFSDIVGKNVSYRFL